MNNIVAYVAGGISRASAFVLVEKPWARVAKLWASRGNDARPLPNPASHAGQQYNIAIRRFCRPCPYYVRKIWNPSFISTVESTVHTNTSPKRRNLKKTGFSFFCGRKTFWKRSKNTSKMASNSCVLKSSAELLVQRRVAVTPARKYSISIAS